MRIYLFGQFFCGEPMNQTQLDPEVEKVTNKFEMAMKSEVLSVEECAKYCHCHKLNIHSAIKRGELKAGGLRNKRITSIALAKWLHGQNA